MSVQIDRHDTDILILGSGGAGMFAALHAQQTAPAGTKITMAVKGLIGKCGCTRMVQGGYNVALGGGVQVGYASLVDLRNGDVVWFNKLQRGFGDLREAGPARESIEALMSGYPSVK